VILNRPARPGLLSGRVTWECRPLDATRMHDAGRCLVGEHDFTAYRAVQCQARNPVRTVRRLEVRRSGELVVLDIAANAFLHHMVRNIAGVLMTIGRGERPVTWAQEVLASRDRRAGGVTAAAEGLYLTGVRYPETFGLPAPPAAALIPAPS
jgi:tRNA pseudouridine38-40 synthase